MTRECSGHSKVNRTQLLLFQYRDKFNFEALSQWKAEQRVYLIFLFCFVYCAVMLLAILFLPFSTSSFSCSVIFAEHGISQTNLFTVKFVTCHPQLETVSLNLRLYPSWLITVISFFHKQSITWEFLWEMTPFFLCYWIGLKSRVLCFDFFRVPIGWWNLVMFHFPWTSYFSSLIGLPTVGLFNYRFSWARFSVVKMTLGQKSFGKTCGSRTLVGGARGTAEGLVSGWAWTCTLCSSASLLVGAAVAHPALVWVAGVRLSCR